MKKKPSFISTGVVFSFFIIFLMPPESLSIQPEKGDKTGGLAKANTYLNLPSQFIKNEGQIDRAVAFYEKSPRHTTYFTKEGVTQTFRMVDKIVSITLRMVKSKHDLQIVGDAPLSGKANYFIGNDKQRWKTNIPTYGAVWYKEVYDNIDVKFYGKNQQLEYDIIVNPAGDPSKVRFAYEGTDALKLNEDGDLVVEVQGNKLIQKKPSVYQELNGTRVNIEGSFVIHDNKTYGFEVGSYRSDSPIIIDPTIVFSTYLGGSSDDLGFAIATDGYENVYLTGTTVSDDFPTVNPLQGKVGVWQAFVTKINAEGNAFVYSTYFGGTANEEAYSIAVDRNECVYITGFTTSDDFPTKNPIQPTLAGSGLWRTDAFITKIDPEGDALVYSTYLGGSNGDCGNEIYVDSSGNAYVVGETLSADFPTKGPLQPVHGGGLDTFVVKINNLGSALVFSTYLGGSGDDRGTGIGVDGTSNVYVCGITASSTDFPLENPLQAGFGGGSNDAFFTKINPSGDALVYSSYLGGSSDEPGCDIAVDPSGNVYVAGYTSSTDFPTQNPLQTHNAGYSDLFIAKVTPAGDAISYSTYLGGSSNEKLGEGIYGKALAIDGAGNVYLTGTTWSHDFPTRHPLYTDQANSDAFVTKINALGNAIVYSTYLGGTSNDEGYGIAVNELGEAHITGKTGFSGFPTKNPLQPGGLGGSNAFVTKIKEVPDISVSPASYDFGFVAVGKSSPALTLTVSNNDTDDLFVDALDMGGPVNQFSILNDTCTDRFLKDSEACTVDVVFSPFEPGQINGTLRIHSNDPDTPILGVSLSGVGTVLPAATLISPSGTITTTTPTYIWNAVPDSTQYYLWVDDPTGTKIQQWYTASEAGCGTGTGTCSVKPTTVLAYGACQWKIQTGNASGVGPWSSPMLFTIKQANIPDKTPPTPNPMTWATPPHQTGPNSISMVATTATDPTQPINYYFDFVSSPTGGLGGKDSGWQLGTSYTNSNLRANHKYGYRVKAKDELNNQTAYSTTKYAYTPIQSPTGITFGTITATSIQARSTNTPAGLSWGSSGLWIDNTTNTTNSGWKRDNTFWTSKTLLPNTSYTFQAKARNGDMIETGYGPSTSKYTRANLPGKASFSDVTRTSIRANWTVNGNPAGTEYQCQNVTTGAMSDWITDTFWNSDNLSCGLSYSFRVKARNGDGVETTWTSLGSQSTVKCITLLTPNGGEMIPSGSTYNSIEWNATPEAVSFDLYYSLDNGVSWPLIKKDERNMIYSWPVPKTIGNKKTCFVKVIGYNDARTKKIGSDTSDKPFTIEVVTVVNPNGGELLHAGQDATIEWRACSDAVKFDLMFSLNNGLNWYYIDDETTPWVIEGKGVTGTSFPTTVLPPDTGNKTTCLIKVIAYNGAGKQIGSDASDKPFTIEVVKLTYPDGGPPPLKQGDSINITWTSYDTIEPITKVQLFYTKDGGVTYSLIRTLSGGTFSPGPYSQSWTIPSVGTTPKTKCKVKVVLKDQKGVIRGSDVSDNYFTIEP